MQEILRYNKARIEIESRFLGLPYAHALVVSTLITRANPVTGIVSDVSYAEIAKVLTINPAPGRKESGTPTKQTIRNYIKSIEREYGDSFKVISEGQSLQFLFPELPQIFNKLVENREVNTEYSLSDPLIKTESNSILSQQDNTEVNIEPNTPNHAVKNIIYKINNNNNNNKQAIGDNFTPTSETLSRALALGYNNAADCNEIQNFIAYNKASGAQWADFNPIYLRWLAKGLERKQQKSPIKHTRSFNHENQNSNHTKTNKPSARERVIQAYAGEFIFCEETRRFDPRDENEQRIYCDFVAAIN